MPPASNCLANGTRHFGRKWSSAIDLLGSCSSLSESHQKRLPRVEILHQFAHIRLGIKDPQLVRFLRSAPTTALRDRALLHGQKRPTGPAHLPPQARLDRSPPDRSLRAALAVSRWIENQTGWSSRKFVRTARRYRTIQIQAGPPHHHRRRPPTSSARPSKPSTAPADLRSSVAEVGSNWCAGDLASSQFSWSGNGAGCCPLPSLT